MTSGSLLPMMCQMSSRARLSRKSQFVMSSAPADEIDTQLNELFKMFAILMVFLTGPVRCLLRGDSYRVILWGLPSSVFSSGRASGD